jgi:hypothetical protein
LEILKDIKPNEKWIDPEFGPNDRDTYGAKNLYFCSNDIPSGCP